MDRTVSSTIVIKHRTETVLESPTRSVAARFNRLQLTFFESTEGKHQIITFDRGVPVGKDVAIIAFLTKDLKTSTSRMVSSIETITRLCSSILNESEHHVKPEKAWNSMCSAISNSQYKDIILLTDDLLPVKMKGPFRWPKNVAIKHYPKTVYIPDRLAYNKIGKSFINIQRTAVNQTLALEAQQERMRQMSQSTSIVEETERKEKHIGEPGKDNVWQKLYILNDDNKPTLLVQVVMAAILVAAVAYFFPGAAAAIKKAYFWVLKPLSFRKKILGFIPGKVVYPWYSHVIAAIGTFILSVIAIIVRQDLS